jgi:hypothetical protein
MITMRNPQYIEFNIYLHRHITYQSVQTTFIACINSL